MRYMVVQLRGLEEPWSSIEAHLLSELRRSLGSTAFAAAGVAAVPERGSPTRPIGIIKGTTAALPSIRAALCLVREVAGKPAAVDVIGVSGTIRAAVQKFMIKKK